MKGLCPICDGWHDEGRSCPYGLLWADEIVAICKERQVPKVVCLCGSTRFLDLFRKANFVETLKGNIVLSVGGSLKKGVGFDDLLVDMTDRDIEAAKEIVDELHLRKVEMADEVLVLSKDGYVGESTIRELDHAKSLGKNIRFWEVEHAE